MFWLEIRLNSRAKPICSPWQRHKGSVLLEVKCKLLCPLTVIWIKVFYFRSVSEYLKTRANKAILEKYFSENFQTTNFIPGRRSIPSKSLLQKKERLFFNRGFEYGWVVYSMTIFNTLEFYQFVATNSNTNISHYKFKTLLISHP